MQGNEEWGIIFLFGMISYAPPATRKIVMSVVGNYTAIGTEFKHWCDGSQHLTNKPNVICGDTDAQRAYRCGRRRENKWHFHVLNSSSKQYNEGQGEAECRGGLGLNLAATSAEMNFWRGIDGEWRYISQDV